MIQSSFWRDRPALVLGCTGFLGTSVVRALLEADAKVIGLVRDSQRDSEFFANKFHEQVVVARGAANRDRLRSLLVTHQPAVVFQLASVAIQPSVKVRITSDLLAVAADVSPTLPIIVPVSDAESRPRFYLRANGQLRVAFVKLPYLFGEGAPNDGSWTNRLFAAAASDNSLPLPTADANLMYAPDAADALLATGEELQQLAAPPTEGLWLEPTPTATARKLYVRVASPFALTGHPLSEAVRNTLDWYKHHPRLSGKEATTIHAVA